LSVEYFLKTAHRLPVEAQKVAAQNLVAACGWYDIEAPEELQKIASLPPKATGFLGRTGELLSGSRLGMHKADVQAAKENLEHHLSGSARTTTFGHGTRPDVTEWQRGGPKHIEDASVGLERAKGQRKEELAKVWGSRGLAGSAAVGAVGGAGYAGHKALSKEKTDMRKVAVSNAWIKRMVTSGVKKNRARKGGNDVQGFIRRMEDLGGKKRRVAHEAAVKAQDSVASRRYEWNVVDHLRHHAHQSAQGVTTGGGAAAGGVGVARAMGALPKKQSDESEKKKKKPSTEKVAATGVERLGARVEEVGHDWEGKGKTMRNVGYGGAVGLGAGSFMPKSKAVRVAMRVGAAAGALGGYVGEGGIRSGRGYQRAGREMQGLPVNQHDVAGFHYSPAAYNEAHRSGEAQRKFDALSAEHTEAKKKVAFGVSTALNLASVPGSVGEVRSNQQKQRAFQSQTGTIATPNQLAGM